MYQKILVPVDLADPEFVKPALDTAADDQPIDHDFDGVVLPAVQADFVLERAKLTVDARFREASCAERRELLLELAFTSANDRREHVDARILRIQHHHVHDSLEGLAGDLLPATGAMRHADTRKEQAQVVVNLCDRADRRSRIRPGGFLFDRDRRRKTVDEIDVGLLHLLEELARVG